MKNRFARTLRSTAIGLATIAVAAGVIAPTVAMAAPSDLSATAAPTSGSAQAPAPAPALAQTTSKDPESRWTKGTRVTVRNDTGRTIWVRQYDHAGMWFAPVQMEPGASHSWGGNWAVVDDVELRFFWREDDAKNNSRFNSTDVDAENPSYSAPWMSVGYDSRWFGIGQTQHWRFSQTHVEFWGKRNDDSRDFKEFDLHVKRLF